MFEIILLSRNYNLLYTNSYVIKIITEREFQLHTSLIDQFNIKFSDWLV